MRQELKNRKTRESERSICLRGERGKVCEFACHSDEPDRSVSCHCIAFQQLLHHILDIPPVETDWDRTGTIGPLKTQDPGLYLRGNEGRAHVN